MNLSFYQNWINSSLLHLPLPKCSGKPWSILFFVSHISLEALGTLTPLICFTTFLLREISHQLWIAIKVGAVYSPPRDLEGRWWSSTFRNLVSPPLTWYLDRLTLPVTEQAYSWTIHALKKTLKFANVNQYLRTCANTRSHSYSHTQNLCRTLHLICRVRVNIYSFEPALFHPNNHL